VAKRVQFLLIGRSAILRLNLFRPYLFLLFRQSLLGLLAVLIQRLGFGHQLQNPILGLADFLLDELNLVLERFVLFVGLGSQHLIPKLGDLLLVHLDVALELLAVFLIAGKRGLVGLQFPQVRFESFLYDGDVPRERGDFFIECGDFLI